MKYRPLTISLLALFLSTSLGAQRGVNAIFREYKRAGDDHIHFILPGAVFKVGSLFGRDRTERRLIRSVRSFRLLVIDGGSPVTGDDMQRMLRRAEGSGMEPLIEVREGGGGAHVAISIKEKRGKITRLLLAVRDGDEFVLMRLKGRIRIEDINKLIEKSSKKADFKMPKLPLPEPKKEEGPQV